MAERITVVTGANRGIGREVARQLAAGGDTVILTARDANKAAAAAKDLSGAGGTIVPQQLDVRDPATAAALAATVRDRYGRLDVLVNNAAISYDTWAHAGDADLDAVRDALDTNLFGAWAVTQSLLPLLRLSGHGRIVNVSSEAGSLAGMGGGTPVQDLQGGSERPDPDARRGAARRRRTGQRGLSRLGGHRHGWRRRSTGGRRCSGHRVGGDASRRRTHRRVLPRPPAVALVEHGPGGCPLRAG